MTTLELNIIAKPKPTQAPVVPTKQASTAIALVLEVGKKYVMAAEPYIVTITDVLPSGRFQGAFVGAGGGLFHPRFDTSGRHYLGNPKRHLVREWLSVEHDAWLAGKPLEYQLKTATQPEHWFTPTPYEHATPAFGKWESSVKIREYWINTFHKENCLYRVRIA